MTTKMKCHYEVLEVQRDATADDLKKSYRKLALRWHPDKNPESADECTAQFRIVQQAYEVLSDSQERAWYDKHREAILRGGHGHGDKYEDDSLDVYEYFNSSCYNGFGDEEDGFYTVYRKVFETITAEDLVFMDDSDVEIPGFGCSTDSYEEVVGAFFDYWDSYCTAKSYVWVEKYDIREAPDRRVRRLMEADNKKLRDAAKKERNEEVRALVAYVKKRDKRVQAYKKKLEERAAEVARKGKEKREQQIQERLKLMEGYQETEWSAMTGLETDLQHLEANLAKQFGEENSDEGNEDEEDGEEEEEDYDDLFCVACNKTFKSEKAFVDHERSRKHRDNVILLKSLMMEEEDSRDAAEMLDGIAVDADQGGGGAEDEDSGDRGEMLDGVAVDAGQGGGGTEDEDEGQEPKQKLSKKEKKKRKQQQKFLAQDDGSAAIVEDLAAVILQQEEDKSFKSRNRRRKDKENNLGTKNEELKVNEELQVSEDSQDGEKLTTDHVISDDSMTQADKDIDPEDREIDPEDRDTASASVLENCSDGTDSRMLDLTNGDSATQEAETDGRLTGAESMDTKSSNKSDVAQAAKQSRCNTCGKDFPSKTKLFTHLTAEGHAQKIAVTRLDDKPSSGKKKKKGKR